MTELRKNEFASSLEMNELLFGNIRLLLRQIFRKLEK
jgi:hypothetical protein